MRRREPMHIPTYEELHGPLPDLSDHPDVQMGIERLRRREQSVEPSPKGHKPITG